MQATGHCPNLSAPEETIAAIKAFLDLSDDGADELYENAPCGYLTTRPDGTIARVNRTFLRWTGYDREALLAGRRFQDLLTVPGRIFYETHFAPLLRLQGEVREVAFDLRLEDGGTPAGPGQRGARRWTPPARRSHPHHRWWRRPTAGATSRSCCSPAAGRSSSRRW